MKLTLSALRALKLACTRPKIRTLNEGGRIVARLLTYRLVAMTLRNPM